MRHKQQRMVIRSSAWHCKFQWTDMSYRRNKLNNLVNYASPFTTLFWRANYSPVQMQTILTTNKLPNYKRQSPNLKQQREKKQRKREPNTAKKRPTLNRPISSGNK